MTNLFNGTTDIPLLREMVHQHDFKPAKGKETGESELEQMAAVLEIAELSWKVERARLGVEYERRAQKEKDAEANQHCVYTFYDAVKEGTIKTAMETISKWHRRDPGMDLKIIMNSPGGSVIDGIALFDYIKSLRDEGVKVEIVTLGYAASMGGILLQAADVRTMGRNSWLMIHELSAGAMGQLSEMTDRTEWLKRVMEQLVSILAERSTLSKAEIEDHFHRQDWWLTAEEALEYGFIDQIV